MIEIFLDYEDTAGMFDPAFRKDHRFFHVGDHGKRSFVVVELVDGCVVFQNPAQYRRHCFLIFHAFGLLLLFRFAVALVHDFIERFINP